MNASCMGKIINSVLELPLKTVGVWCGGRDTWAPPMMTGQDWSILTYRYGIEYRTTMLSLYDLGFTI